MKWMLAMMLLGSAMSSFGQTPKDGDFRAYVAATNGVYHLLSVSHWFYHEYSRWPRDVSDLISFPEKDWEYSYPLTMDSPEDIFGEHRFADIRFETRKDGSLHIEFDFQPHSILVEATDWGINDSLGYVYGAWIGWGTGYVDIPIVADSSSIVLEHVTVWLEGEPVRIEDRAVSVQPPILLERLVRPER